MKYERSSLDMEIHIWRAPRIIRLLRHHGARPRHSLRGVPAGDSYSDICIKVHAVEEYDRYVSLRSYVDVSSFTDDSSIGVEGRTAEYVIER